MLTACLVVGHSPRYPGAVALDGTAEHPYNTRLRALIAGAVCGVSLVEAKRPDLRSAYAGIVALPPLINATAADFCVEMHFNGYRATSARGSEALYWHGSERSKALARHLVDAFDAAGFPARRTPLVAVRSEDQRGGLLLKRTSMPCVIAEPFFGSNADDWDAATLRTGELAIAYARAIEAYAAGHEGNP